MDDCNASEFDKLRARKAKDYLATVRAASMRLARQRQRRTEQLERMGLKATVYTGMPGCPNSYGDAIPDGVAKLDAISDAMAAAEREWESAIDTARQCLCAMPDPDYSEMLELRYIDSEIWPVVAMKLGKSASWCQYSKVPALVQLYDTMPCEFRIPRVPAL